MRNSIKVLDPSYPRVAISDLDAGQLFQFKDRKNDDAIYMKLDAKYVGYNRAVHLATGIVFEVNVDTYLCRVSLVQIGSTV